MDNTTNYAARRSSGMSIVSTIAMILLIVGGLNWGLVGLLNFDLVAALFGQMSTLSRIIYTLVGVSAVYSLFLIPRLSRAS